MFFILFFPSFVSSLAYAPQSAVDVRAWSLGKLDVDGNGRSRPSVVARERGEHEGSHNARSRTAMRQMSMTGTNRPITGLYLTFSRAVIESVSLPGI